MSTLTLVVDKDKKAQYKDYVHFLKNYKNGKREESDNSESYSLTSSRRNSSSSVNSEVNELPTKSFNEYLQNYNNKKFQPVHPNLNKNDETKPKNVKTEVFIQVNNTNNTKVSTNGHSPANKVQNTEEYMTSHPHVDEIAKVFEKTSNTDKKPKHVQQRKQKFNLNSSNPTNFPSSLRVRQNSFESNQPKNNTNAKITADSENLPNKSESVVNGSIAIKVELSLPGNHPKPPVPQVNNFIQPQNVPKKITILPKINMNTNFPSKSEVFRTETVKSPAPSKENSVESQIITSISGIPPPPPPPPVNFSTIPIPTPSVKTIPDPPKFSPIASVKTIPTPPKFPGTLPPSPVSSLKTIPVPPKFPGTLPPSPKPSVKTVPASPNFSNNRASTLPRMPKTTEKIQSDSVDSSTLNRNDPRVKKVVYGALRNMYGAYHDKANDYLATLPKNRVKKSNGLDSIINSIAAQGGLDKLSGRAKVEKD